MAMTPEEREAIKEELRREMADAAKTPEEKAAEQEEDKFLDKLADKLHGRLTAKGDDKDKDGDGKPEPEKKPRSGHPMERRLFGKKD